MVRIKHRYLLINILYPDQTAPTQKASTPDYVAFHSPSPAYLTPGLFLSHLRASIVTHFGDCGLGLTSSSLKLVYLSNATSTAIIRCSRQHFRIVWASLTFITELPGERRGEIGKKCVMQVVRVSGTIRKSEEELLRRTRNELVRAHAAENGSAGSLLERLTAPQTAGNASKTKSGGDSIMDVNSDDESEDES